MVLNGSGVKCVNQGQGPRKEGYHFLGSSNDFGSRSHEVHGMPIVWSPPVDSTGDVVYNRRGQSQLVVKLYYAWMGSMGDIHSRREGRRSVRVDSVSTVVETRCHEGQCGFRQVGRRDGEG